MEKQIRYSKQREQILEYLQSVETHPDADAIFYALKEKDSSVSIATVYRNLAFLSARGAILKIDTGNAKANYDGNIHPHQHYVCTLCGKIIDIKKPPTPPIDMDCGTIDNISVIYYGRCKECENKVH